MAIRPYYDLLTTVKKVQTRILILYSKIHFTWLTKTFLQGTVLEERKVMKTKETMVRQIMNGAPMVQKTKGEETFYGFQLWNMRWKHGHQLRSDRCRLLSSKDKQHSWCIQQKICFYNVLLSTIHNVTAPKTGNNLLSTYLVG